MVFYVVALEDNSTECKETTTFHDAMTLGTSLWDSGKFTSVIIIEQEDEKRPRIIKRFTGKRQCRICGATITKGVTCPECELEASDLWLDIESYLGTIR